jgi:hypothetical protein
MMANLDSLNYQSITSSTLDEALELLRVIRLNRRTPVKFTKPKTETAKSKNVKSYSKMSSEDAAELLKLITGGS